MAETEKADLLDIGVFGQESNVVTTTVKIVDVLLFLRSNLLIHLIDHFELLLLFVSTDSVITFYFVLEAWSDISESSRGDVAERGEGDVVTECEAVVCVGYFRTFLFEVDVDFVILAFDVAIKIIEYISLLPIFRISIRPVRE